MPTISRNDIYHAFINFLNATCDLKNYSEKENLKKDLDI